MGVVSAGVPAREGTATTGGTLAGGAAGDWVWTAGVPAREGTATGAGGAAVGSGTMVEGMLTGVAVAGGVACGAFWLRAVEGNRETRGRATSSRAE